MKKSLKELIVCATLMLALVACDDGDSTSTACEGATMEATINGSDFTNFKFNNTLLKVEGTKRMDIRATDSNGRQLIITLSDQTGSAGNGITTDEYIAFADITTGTENTFFFTIIQGSVSYSFIEGSLDITSCDAEGKRVSGTFSFEGDEFEVTAGSFDNLCYKVN